MSDVLLQAILDELRLIRAERSFRAPHTGDQIREGLEMIVEDSKFLPAEKSSLEESSPTISRRLGLSPAKKSAYKPPDLPVFLRRP